MKKVQSFNNILKKIGGENKWYTGAQKDYAENVAKRAVNRRLYAIKQIIKKYGN